MFKNYQKNKALKYLSKILNINWLTHDVFQLKIVKPESFIYHIGQAVEITLGEEKAELRAPFTITSNYESSEEIEFIIKVYPKHYGFTSQLSRAKVNDILFISEAWDSFSYEGPGIFIAAGSGITPFVPLLRRLKKQNRIDGHQLFFANKKSRDIILKDELKYILGNSVLNILSKESINEFPLRHIDFDFLSEHIRTIDQFFYLCGPTSFIDSVKRDLIKVGVKEELIQTIY